jgi:Fic family protein
MNIGNIVQQPQGYKAFIPNEFPPKSEIHFSSRIYLANDKATLALGKLDGVAQLIPDINYFISTYAQKEAALSSNIEGTKATMHDALRAGIDMTEDIPDDVENILSYMRAINHGFKRAREMPLTLRIIRELHEQLMQFTKEGIGKTPGEFRKTQNWIGGTRPDNADFVPPPPHKLLSALGDLEVFINSPQPYPPLIVAALMHAQFETIHPFLDGNGRTGRLLITLQLRHQGVLEYPILYLSEYFRRHRDTYFNRLADYHNKGELERWVLFFLEGIAEVASEATEVSKKIVNLREKHMTLAHSLGGRQAKTAVKLLVGLYKQPIIDVATAEKITGLSRPAANALVKKFVDIGILSLVDETDTYGRQFVYSEYLILFHEPEIKRHSSKKEK